MDFDVNVNTFTYESALIEYDDFPFTEEPVYILGESYSAIHDRDELKDDVMSRIWITYRKNFQNIGGVGPSGDQGWGCMLRCGQMMLAQALVLRHLGREWRWKPENSTELYWRVLQMFGDKKAATYSIHQIASMGESEGKAVGQWFGPNTIAQVLKRISVYDGWSNIVLHIAMDNVVIQDDIREKCRSCREMVNGELVDLPEGENFSSFVNDAPAQNQSSADDGSTKDSGELPWRPLLLIIPLRLGLTDINPIYFDALKTCLSLKQSVGIIGGKPNHAHWFIGYVDKELIYLDPHTTQPFVDLHDSVASDTSYHCITPPSRMSFHKLDPSIALGFYCASEKEFDDLCDRFTIAYDRAGRSMFEVRKKAPAAWPCGESSFSSSSSSKSKVSPAAKKRTRVNSLSECHFSADGGSSTTHSSNEDDEEFEII